VINKPLFESSPELEGSVKRILDDVYATGKPFIANEIPVQLKRKGRTDTVYFNTVYQPLHDLDNKIYGIIVVGIEVTEAVNARKIVEAGEKRSEVERKSLHDFFTQAPAMLAILKGPDHLFEFANPAYLELIGNRNPIGKTVLEALPEIAGQGFNELLDKVYNTGETFNGKEMPIKLDKGSGKYEQFFLNFIYQASTNDKGETDGILVFAYDVTEQVMARKQIEASEKRFSNILSQSLMAIAILKGPEMVVAFANEPMLEVLGKGNAVLNKPLLEGVPELKDQAFPQLLANVYTTGVALEGFEIKAILVRNGIPVNAYFNFVYQPYRDVDDTITGITVLATEVTEEVLAKKQIEASEKRFSNILSQSLMAIAIFKGPDMVVAFANEPMLNVLGKGNAVLNKPLVEGVPELKDQVFPQLLADVYATGLAFEGFEIKAILVRNGIPVETYFNFVYQPYRDVDDTITGITVLATEVTSYVIAKKRIEASEKRFSNILEKSIMGVSIFKGSEMRIAFANEPMIAILGKGKEIIGKALLEVLPELEGQPFPKLLDEVFTTGVPYYGYETKAILERNGKAEETYFNFVYQPYREADNSITGITVLVTEVGEQVNAKKQIEESENRFRIFADSIQNLAWIANGDGMIFWYNQRWYDYTGTTLEEMQGSGWQKVHHPNNIEKVIEFQKEAWKKGEAFELTFQLRRADGEYHWFLTCAYPVKDINGNIERWIGTNTDITQQKMFTEELEMKVKERTEELQEKNLTLERTNAELNSFSYVASHDLKEPLRKIQVFSKLINETEDISDTTQDYFNRIISAAERMQNLIDSLLNLSYVNSTEMIFAPCDLNTLVEESKNDLLISISEKEAIIEHENLPVIIGVRVQIYQVITNLLDNAIKYSRPEIKPLIKITSSIIEGKKIEHTSANKQTKYHAIKFSDNGIGFEQEYANKIFELFQRLHEKNKYSGTGIGLGIVKKVVSSHNGLL
ncbi:MAG: PAS domain-containing protein, partial [Chitinophagaceae bacterium]